MPVDRNDILYKTPAWAWPHSLRFDAGASLSAGLLWGYTPPVASVATSGTHTLEWLVGDQPIGLFSFLVQSDGSRSVDYEFYAGGTVTPGAAVTGLPRNHHEPKQAPLDEFTDGATVVTPGTLVAVGFMGSTDRGTSESGGGFMVLAPETRYYLTFTNTDAQTALLNIELALGRLLF